MFIRFSRLISVRSWGFSSARAEARFDSEVIAMRSKRTTTPRRNMPGEFTAISSIRCVRAGPMTEFGLDERFVAIWADGMAESGLRMLADIGIDLLPIVCVVADFLAVHANREQSLELFHARQGILQFPDACHKVPLQFHDARSHPHSGQQFLRIERLGHIVVRSGLEALNDVRFGVSRGQEDEICGLGLRTRAGPVADLRTVQTWHHPVQDGQIGLVFLLKHLPDLGSVLRGYNLITPTCKN